MIIAYGIDDGRLCAYGKEDADAADAAGDLRGAAWIDLADPTPREAERIATTLGVTIPPRAEMEEIETSSRLYQDETATFMTALLPTRTDTDRAEILPVSFVLAGDRLITVRYHQPKAFAAFVQHASRVNMGSADGLSILVGLLDAVIDRVADILELVGQDVDRLSKTVFPREEKTARDFQSVLKGIGGKGDLLSIIRDSLATFDRLFRFLANVAAQRGASREVRARIKTLSRDAASLIDHASFLSQKVTFLLDATLGMISIEQNAIIKIFSVAAVIFLPPTLVASIYGMNYTHMPELEWAYGYPFALGLMAVSAVLPYLFFKRRGWL